jgi:chromosomal replication initiator protein
MNLTTENGIVWNNFLQSVERQLNKQIFDAWFRPIHFDGCDHDERVLRLRASQVTRDWVNTYYIDLIDKTLDELDMPSYQISWEVEDGRGADDSVIEDDVDFFFEVQPAATGFTGQHRNNVSSADSAPAETPAPVTASTFNDPDPIENSLNPKYSFSNFVVGSCNEFGHAAALAIAEAPGKTYNPLYLYGGVGLGKTHLMHAAGHAIKQRYPHMRVAYLSAEKFMNELINAIRYSKTQNFRDKYRLIDVLMIDDVQFMTGKRTQEEFFHTFNALHNEQKQIVISSDCSPREIPSLEERLHSRFEWGLIADLEPPDLETKVAILKRKADLDGFTLSDDVAFFIAGKVKNNIRELEGSLVRLIAISSLRGLPISKMLAQDALRNIVDNDDSEGLTMEKIGRQVAARYNLSLEELKEKNNSRQIAVPRQVAMYLCKRLTKHSFPEIGREFGGKHHTTVMHSFEKISTLLKTDKDLHRVISELIDTLCG